MITLRNLTLRRGTKVLLDNVSVTLNPGEKVGLVGRNGAGKSSLFGLLNGSLHEDAGEFSVPSQWRLSQVEQHMPESDDSATAFGMNSVVINSKTLTVMLIASSESMAAMGSGRMMSETMTTISAAIVRSLESPTGSWNFIGCPPR